MLVRAAAGSRKLGSFSPENIRFTHHPSLNPKDLQLQSSENDPKNQVCRAATNPFAKPLFKIEKTNIFGHCDCLQLSKIRLR
jgi:hypothetical protein